MGLSVGWRRQLVDRPGFHDNSLRLSWFPARGTGVAQPVESRVSSQHGQRRQPSSSSFTGSASQLQARGGVGALCTQSCAFSPSEVAQAILTLLHHPQSPNPTRSRRPVPWHTDNVTHITGLTPVPF